MAKDPNQITLSDISQSLQDINDRDALNSQLDKNEKLLDRALENENKKLSEEQLEQLRQTKSLLSSDNLQNMEDKREANRQLNEQLRLLGVIADKGGLLAPIGFIAGVGFGIKDSLVRLLNIFDIKLNKPLAEAITKLRGGVSRLFSVPTIFLADNLARFIDVFDFNNLGINKISQELLDKTSDARLAVRRFFMPATQLKETIKLYGGAFTAVLKDFRANFLAGMKNKVGPRVITQYTDEFLKSIGGALRLANVGFAKVDFRFKEFKGFERVMKFADSLGDFIRPIARLVKGFTTLFLLPVAFFARIFGEELKDVSKGIKGTKDAVSGTGKSVGIISKTFGEIGKALGNVTKVAFKFGRVLGRFFVPIAAIIAVFDTVRGAFEGWTNTEGNIFMKAIGAWFGAVEGLLNSVVGGLLDLLKDGISWVLGKLGFENAANFLDSFSFQDIISKIVNAVKNGLFAVIDFFGSAASKAGSFIGSGLSMINNFIKALLQSVLPDPDSEDLIPRLASKAIPSFVYEYAGMDPYTGDVIEKFDSPAVDAIGQVMASTPLGIAANAGQAVANYVRNNNQSNHNYYTSDSTDTVGNSLQSPT